MSSYLNIYVKPKKTEKPLLLTSFSRSSDIYQCFNEKFNLYSSTGELTEITKDMINEILTDLYNEIEKDKDRYISYLEAKNKANVEDISSLKEYIQEKENCKAQLELLQYIIYDCSLDFTGFEKVLAYID